MSTQAAAGVVPWPAPRIPVGISTAGTREESPFFARFVAVLAALLGVGHVWIMVAFPHGAWVGTLLGLMVLLCLKCAHRAWNRPEALVELLAMSALMALVHKFMALGVHEHAHGEDTLATSATAGAAAMLAVAAAELVMVMLCGLGLRLAAARNTLGITTQP